MDFLNMPISEFIGTTTFLVISCLVIYVVGMLTFGKILFWCHFDIPGSGLSYKEEASLFAIGAILWPIVMPVYSLVRLIIFLVWLLLVSITTKEQRTKIDM